MGKIDKEKLIEKLVEIGYLTDNVHVINTIKNFPEEPEIDFDALFDEFYKNECDGKTCSGCKYNDTNNNTDTCFAKFLKSKNLTASKHFDIPVKKTWTLKKEFEKYSRSIGHTPTTLIVNSSAPQNIEFYDYREEPDYSKIPKGSIVELKSNAGYNCFRVFSEYSNSVIFCHMENIENSVCKWNVSQFVRVVELANGGAV